MIKQPKKLTQQSEKKKETILNYDSDLEEQNNTNDKNNNTIKISEEDMAVIEKYSYSREGYDYIKDEEVRELFASLDTMGTTMAINNCAVMDYDYYKNYTVTSNDLSQEMVGYVVLQNLYRQGVLELKEGSTFTKTQVHETVKKVFGENYNYQDHSIINCPSITFDGKETYTIGSSGCGGTCGPKNLKKVVDYKKSDDNIYIYVRILFKGNGMGTDYYKNYAQTQPIKDGLDMEKGSLYKLTFQKVNNNYVFKSSELQP